MKEKPKPGSTPNPVDIWRSLKQDALREQIDEIAAMTDDELDEHIRCAGGDPAALRAAGADLLQELLERRERLTWQRELDTKVPAPMRKKPSEDG